MNKYICNKCNKNFPDKSKYRHFKYERRLFNTSRANVKF